MCDRCKTQFTIHDLNELIVYMRGWKWYNASSNEEVLKLWYDRGYFNNLIYLEFLSKEKEVADL